MHIKRLKNEEEGEYALLKTFSDIIMGPKQADSLHL